MLPLPRAALAAGLLVCVVSALPACEKSKRNPGGAEAREPAAEAVSGGAPSDAGAGPAESSKRTRWGSAAFTALDAGIPAGSVAVLVEKSRVVVRRSGKEIAVVTPTASTVDPAAMKQAFAEAIASGASTTELFVTVTDDAPYTLVISVMDAAIAAGLPNVALVPVGSLP